MLPSRRWRRHRNLAKSASMQFHLLSVDPRFVDNRDAAQLDLINDLDNDFFATSYELVQCVAPINNFVASKFKRFVDIVARMQQLYIAEVSKNFSMQMKVVDADQKLRLAIETTSNSNDKMEKLKESLEEAWRDVDAMNNREAAYHETHTEPQEGPIGILNSSAFQREQDEHRTKEMRLRAIVFRERDRLARELMDYQKRLETNRQYVQSIESLIEDHRTTVKKQQARIKSLEADLYHTEHKNRLNTESLEEKVIVQRKDIQSLEHTIFDLRVVEKKLLETTAINEHLKHAVEKFSHENYTLAKRNHHHMEDKNQLRKHVKNLEVTLKSVSREKDELELKYKAAVRDMKKIKDSHVLLSRRFHQLAKKNLELSEQHVLTTNELTVVERKLAISISKLEEMVRHKSDGERERDRLRGVITGLHDAIANLKHDLFIQRTQIHDLQLDVEHAHKVLDDKDIKIHNILKEKNELLTEVNDMSKAIERLEEKSALKTEKLKKLHHKLNEKHIALMQTKKHMEKMHNEKSLLERNYEICFRDRQTYQTLNGQLTYQINQLCHQLSLHEKEVVQVKNQIDQLKNMIKRKQTEVHGLERQITNMRTVISERKVHNQQLQRTIEEDEKRMKHIACSLDDERTEKNLVGQQMVRRNDELCILREKLSTMQLALKHGHVQYKKRVDDIRLLKSEISNLRMSNLCLQRSVTATANLRHEVVRLERQLLRERLNVAAFTEELKHPYRIHRWRVLRGRDPQKFELISKMQILLKRNIRLTADRTNMLNRMQDAEKLYETLKRQVEQISDPVTEQMLWKQRHLNERQSRKLRAMKAEMAITIIDLKAQDCIIQRLQQLLKNQTTSTVSGTSIRAISSYQKAMPSEKYTEHVFGMSDECAVNVNEVL